MIFLVQNYIDLYWKSDLHFWERKLILACDVSLSIKKTSQRRIANSRPFALLAVNNNFLQQTKKHIGCKASKSYRYCSQHIIRSVLGQKIIPSFQLKAIKVIDDKYYSPRFQICLVDKTVFCNRIAILTNDSCKLLCKQSSTILGSNC